MSTLSILDIPVRTDLQIRLVNVSTALVGIHSSLKIAHDEPQVDQILQGVDQLLAETHKHLDQLRSLQQSSSYAEAAGAADRTSKEAKKLSDLLQKASILLKQRASSP